MDAGAEIIFPEALKDEKEFEIVRKSLDCYLLANMTEFGKSKLLDKKIACCLYTGIMTDTGSFRYPSTTSKTHQVVSHLLSLGANSSEIHQKR